MEGIADFLDALLGGVDLSFFSLAVGSIIWGIAVLKPWHTSEQGRPFEHDASIVDFTIRCIYFGAFALFALQLIEILVKAWLIAETLNRWPFPAFAETVRFKAGLLRAFFALLLAGYTRIELKKEPRSIGHWTITAYLMVPMVASGAWLVHAAGRFDNTIPLMIMTVLHQVGAAIWLGGIAQLLGIWRLRKHDAMIEPQWPLILQRFTVPGVTAVVLLLATGVPMAWIFVNSWSALFGSGYGNLLLVKGWMLMIALGFAWLNHYAARQQPFNANSAVNRRVPFYIEAEAFVLIALLFTAASLSSQPPPVDIPELTASWSEVINTFKPRMPRFSSPSHAALLAGEAGRTAIIGQTASIAATEWSNYNHNMAGVILFVLSLVALLSYNPRFPKARYWPLGFAALFLFLFFRSDAEAWPMGPLGFWESAFSNSEILQHRLAALLTLAFAVFEYRARKTDDPNSRLPYLFPILVAIGGLMLLTHSHVGFQAKTEFLIQIGHTTMGLLAIVMACGRWLELRLEPPIANIAGLISVTSMLLISFILMFYREPF